MPTTASKTIGNVELRLVAYHNCDDVELFWQASVSGQRDAPIPEVLGFTIERQRRQPDGAWGKSELIRNRVGFSAGPEDEAGQAPTNPSSIWPFQCFDWTDHGANSGQTVRYRASAVRLPTGGTLGETALEPVADSDW